MKSFEEYASSRLIDDFINILEFINPEDEPTAPITGEPIVAPSGHVAPSGEKARESSRDEIVDREARKRMGKVSRSVDKLYNLIKQNIKRGSAKYVPSSTVDAGRVMQGRDNPPDIGATMARLAAHYDPSNHDQLIERLRFIEVELPPKRSSGSQVFNQLKQIINSEMAGLVTFIKSKAYMWNANSKRHYAGEEASSRLRKRQLTRKRSPDRDEPQNLSGLEY